LKFISDSRKTKEDPKSEEKESNLGHSVNKSDENPKELETNSQPKALAPKVDVPETKEEYFEPRFDSFFDGDRGDIDKAMEHLVAKSLQNSAENATLAQTSEKTTVKNDELPPQSPTEARPEVPEANGKDEEASDVDLLRVRLWRARASHSRQAGLALVILSAALFAGAFFTSALILEIGSVSSFVIGVALLAYEAEPRVKLFPSMSSLIGPLMVVKNDLEKHGVSYANAIFEASPSPESGRDSMSFVVDHSGEGAHRYSIPPLGEGLVHAYELELGDLTKLGVDGAKVWLPRVMVDGLGLAGRVEMKSSGNEVTTVIEKPFVRILCVQEFMTNGLCQTSGCPLAASVGQALARASGKPVTHHGCTYDPVTQKATLKDTIEQ